MTRAPEATADTEGKGDSKSKREAKTLEVPNLKVTPSTEQLFTAWSSARNHRRLKDRWKCQTAGHSWCFMSGSSLHFQLTDEMLEEWARVMDDGYASLLYPPDTIVSRKLYKKSTSFLSPGNSVSYTRPFHFKMNPTLSELRSWEDNLSMRSSKLSWKTAQGPRGIGSLSSKAIYWVGKQAIGTFRTANCQRRIWLVKRLIGQLEKQPVQGRGQWLEKKQRELLRRVDDLLELSSDKYEQKYQTTSAACGGRLRASLLEISSEDKTELEAIYQPIAFWFVSLKLAPLDFLREDWNAFDALAINLREILLQEDTDPSELDYMIDELIRCACEELSFDRSPSSRRHAYEFMQQAYIFPEGRKVLESMAQPGGGLEGAARQLFNGEVTDYAEQACGVRFFVAYADDHPTFRNFVLGPNGLAIIPQLKSLIGDSMAKRSEINWKAISWTCRAIRSIVRSPWLIPSLLDLDTCRVLVQVLLSHQGFDRPEIIIDYWIICAFRDLMVIGKEMGSRAVQEAMSDEVRRVLQKLKSRDAGVWDQWMVDDAVRKIPEILGED